MSIFENPNYMQDLKNLLSPPNENDSDSDSDVGYDNSCKKPSGIQNLGPGNFVNKPGVKKESKNESKNDSVKIKEKKTLPIDDDKDEIEKWLEQQEKEDSDVLDGRKCPDHNIIYKQAIGTEDLFLQMGNRSASSTSCEDMIISINLPEEKVGIKEMDLSVNENEIELKTSIYHLKLPLVQPIDPDKGSAKYDSEKKILLLTLRMKRELDFINF